MMDTTTTTPGTGTPLQQAVAAYRQLRRATGAGGEVPASLEQLRSWAAEDMGRPAPATTGGCCAEGEPPAALADMAAAAYDVALLLQARTPNPQIISKVRRRLAEGGLPWPNTCTDPAEYRTEALEVLAHALNDARRPA